MITPRRHFSRTGAIRLVGASVIVGIVIIALVFAAGAAGFFEPENGTLTGAAQIVTAAGASGGKAVRFGTSTPVPTPAPTPPPVGTLNLPRIPWEGGPSYYAQFSRAAAWNNPSFFPIGVWFEGTYNQQEIDLDKGAGLNTYIELTGGSNLPLIRSNGMFAAPGTVIPGYGSETIGWLIDDEADMKYGGGWDAWDEVYNNTVSSWNSCIPKQSVGGKCGYTVEQTDSAKLPSGDGRMKYSNYGKGVMMWEPDSEAQVFVNQFQQFVSADIYWYTDPNLCGGESAKWLGIPSAECQRSANYGTVIDRLRLLDAMDGKRQPIFGFIEDGHPASESTAPTITGPQLAGAVFNSLIHEARGIIYFNHNFGGPCQSQHVLRDCGLNTIRPTVTQVDSYIQALAPVLNTQSYQYSFNGSLDTMLKEYGGSYYIFAMQKRPGTTGSYQFTLPAGMGGASVSVLNENRTLPISGGKFTDSFAAEYSYHIYKVTP